jgi:diaminohydroxyphosphoribosylaminopyrimidine deaminase/5-amino-6-(5-phosphoribosylamino)uracil reductase
MNNYMRQALQLAELGRKTVAPNPMVGCVIERDGKAVGYGWHKKAGLPHAEIEALRDVGDKAKGANVYVTLEPCCHYGRTLPCVNALIEAQVKSVHIAVCDPNPLVNGRGIKKLKQAGIEVYVGEGQEAAEKQNEVFFHYITTKRPFVIAKWAMSLDGRIATDCGHAKWITSEKARKHVHQTRRQMGAILVGVNTVIKDNPQLTVRLVNDCISKVHHPLRIVLDSTGRIPIDSKVLSVDLPGKTLIATTEKSKQSWRKKLLEQDCEVLVLPKDQDGKVEIRALLDELGRREITSLFVEGGRETLTSFVEEGLVNKFHVYIAAKLIGGEKLTNPLLSLGISDMSNAMQLTYEKYRILGDDIFIEAKLVRRNICLQE